MNQIKEKENDKNEEEPANKENTPLPALQNKKISMAKKYFCPALNFSTNRRVELRWDNLTDLHAGPATSSSKITTPVILGRKTPDVNSGASRCENIIIFLISFYIMNAWQE